VWLSHQEFLRRRSFRLSGGNRADAEDALGNAMLRAAQAYARQPVQNPRAWLLRILHNACMDQHRRNACLSVMGDFAVEPAPAPEAWPRAAPSPEEELSLAESERTWTQAMRALPGPLNDPLRLHLEGWGDDEIARRLNISRELVRKRRQLAKDRLRQFLAP
jgi:RNA polymerase sigma factor (sigma-70 family)